MATAEELGKKMVNLITNDRAKQNGDKVLTHSNIGSLWTAYLSNHFGKEIFIRPDMVADMMELFKIARRQNGTFNTDDYVDAAGYAVIGAEIRSRVKPLGDD